MSASALYSPKPVSRLLIDTVIIITIMAPIASDDKISTLLTTLPQGSTGFSLEFFPPKTQAGFTNLQSRLARMTAALRPLYVTVTWGAGGSTATKSLELAEICQRQLGVPTVLHLTCTNMNRQLVDEALEECKAVGIRNILALRGDPPREEYRDEQEPLPHNTSAQEEEFTWAVDLVRYIRKKHGDYFCIGVAGYPEGHADESHPEAGKQNVDHDLPYLAEKVRASADFIMTQLTYDVEAYQAYEEKLNNYIDQDGTKDIFKNIPVIPGLMPIQNYQVIKRITKLSHAKIPSTISDRIEAVKGDDELVKKVGVDILSEIVEKFKALPKQSNLPRILHFYTLNLEKSVAFILERCNLIPPPSQPDSSSEDSEDNDAVVDDIAPISISQTRKSSRASSMNAQPHNRVILDQSLRPNSKSTNRSRDPSQVSSTSRQHEASDKGSGIPASAPTRTHNLMISEGQGSLGREATWDDFPNGRWGPSHSPAFGEIDGYGPSLKVGPITARKLWGHPTQRSDVTKIFKQHVLGQLPAVPWSDEVDANIDLVVTGSENTTSTAIPGALRAETETIRSEILRLIQEKGYWTLASQPAVDGVRSDHPIFGWGPRGEGFVFQKAFVEFFCPKSDWPHLKRKLRDASTVEFSWLKTDARGRFESSDLDDGNADAGTLRDSIEDLSTSTLSLTSKPMPGVSGVNAVTWGVFRGKEIISPTIIEAESFRAWGEEAFNIWEEWRRCFPRGSTEEKCLEACKNDVVLVNVVGQTFIGGHKGLGGGLWRVLLDDGDVLEDKKEQGVNGQ